MLELTVLRAAQLARLRDALAANDDARIAAAADPDPFAARSLLSDEEQARVAQALAQGRSRRG